MNKGVISILSTLAGAGIATAVMGKVNNEKVNAKQVMSDKHEALFVMMNQWVRIKQEGKVLASYFEVNGYKKIAIYGMGCVGETLLSELEGTNIEVAYGIDRNKDCIYSDIDVVSVEDKLEDVDVIVVTAISFFEEIAKTLSAKIHCPILSLEDILYDV